MSQDQLIAASIIVVVVAAVFTLMAVSWRRRVARQASIGFPEAPPPTAAAPFAELAGLHLGTTVAGRPLDRLAIAPLGFRSRGALLVGSDGIELRLAGSDPVFIPTAAISGHGRSTWTIDRGVEEDGLNRLSWRLHDTDVDTYFRMREPEAFDAALARLAGARP